MSRWKNIRLGVLIPFLLIIFLGFSLRLFRIDYQSFWFDEAASVHFTNQNFPHDFFSVIGKDVHPSLYFLLLKGWIIGVGDSDLSVRAFSAICSIFTLLIFCSLALRFLSRPGALFAISLCALSSFQIWYAQEARPYALVALLGSIHLSLFFSLIERPSWKQVLSHGVVAALLLHTLYLSAFFLLSEVLALIVVVIIRRPTRIDALKQLSSIFFSSLIALLCFLPWISIALHQFESVSKSYWISLPSIRDFFSLFIKYLSFELNWNSAAPVFISIAIVVALILEINTAQQQVEERDISKYNRDSFFLKLFAFLTFTPPFLCFLFSTVTSSVFLPRGLILSSLPFYLFLGGLSSRIPLLLPRAVFRAVLIGLCCAFYSNMWLYPAKDNWKKGAAYVATMARPEDSYIFEAPGVELPFERYFNRPIPSFLRVEDTPITHRVWVIKSMSDRSDDEIIKELSKKGYERWHGRRVLGIKIMLFGKRSNTEPK